MKNIWNVVHESDDENGNPTLYSLKLKEGKFYWIEETNKGFDVIDTDARTVLKTCKSLTSAKRWVTENLL